jgi:enamine deaminase RidA (YjgF/YER057c/UK114 family)
MTIAIVAHRLHLAVLGWRGQGGRVESLHSYVQITIPPAGRLAFISGQTAINKDIQSEGAGDQAPRLASAS